MTDKKKDEPLPYGQGQREQYGEGEDYRPEDKTEAVDNKDGGWLCRRRPAFEQGVSDLMHPDKAE